MSTSNPDRCLRGTETSVEITATVAEELASLGDDTAAAKAARIADYLLDTDIQGHLDAMATGALEAEVRSKASVANLGAVKTADAGLRSRLFSFHLGRLDAEDGMEIQGMIDSDPEVARQADRLREMIDGIQAATKTVKRKPWLPDINKLISTYPMGPMPKAAPIDSYGILIDHADGKFVDKATKAVLNEMVLDYIDGELDTEVTEDLEAVMRLYPNVARLVADMTDEAHIETQVSMFLDGELDPESAADVQRLIRNDPKIARTASRFREAMDFFRMEMQLIVRQPQSPKIFEPISANAAAARLATVPAVRFRSLIPYALRRAIDGETQSILDDVITGYIDGSLDRALARGLEATMRLCPDVARLVAERTEANRSSW